MALPSFLLRNIRVREQEQKPEACGRSAYYHQRSRWVQDGKRESAGETPLIASLASSSPPSFGLGSESSCAAPDLLSLPAASPPFCLLGGHRFQQGPCPTDHEATSHFPCFGQGRNLDDSSACGSEVVCRFYVRRIVLLKV